MMISRSRVFPLVFVLLVSCAGSEVTSPTKEAPVVNNKEELPLEAVIKNGTQGLTQEDPILRDRLQDEAREYIRIKRLRRKAAERKEALEDCQSDDLPSPYCRLIDHEKRIEKKLSRHGTVRESVRRLVRQLRAGKIDDLLDASEAQIHMAVKSVPIHDSLDKATETALKTDPCPSTLLTALGFRSEEAFPSTDAKSKTKEIYLRALSCGSGPALARAAYRLGMIHLWEGDLDQAEANLSKIFNDPDGYEYRQRVLYWRWYIAGQKKNTDLQKELHARLIREFPLSLHALMLGSVNSKLEDQPILSPKELKVQLRSKTAPELNLTVAAAETLQAMQEPLYSSELLSPLADRLKDAEPEFRLYVAVLLMRAGDSLTKFQVLAGLFRERPQYITKTTLEMLYPLSQYEVARSHEAKLDPYFVLSLIRQESAFNERARSRAGAIGLMQLMPRTARTMERVSKNQLYKPEVNIRLGVKYFSRLLEKYDGDTELALAAYNAGADRVAAWVRRYPTDNRLLFLDMMPFRETRDYVASITRNYFWYLTLYEQRNDPAAREQRPTLTFSLLKSASPKPTDKKTEL